MAAKSTIWGDDIEKTGKTSWFGKLGKYLSYIYLLCSRPLHKETVSNFFRTSYIRLLSVERRDITLHGSISTNQLLRNFPGISRSEPGLSCAIIRPGKDPA